MKVIVFDVDGTLCHIRTDYDSLRARLAELEPLPFKPLFPTVRSLSSAKQDAALRLIEQAEVQGALDAEAVSEIDRLLPALAETYRLAAYSSNCPRAIFTALQKFGWCGHFDLVLGRNHPDDVKPNPRFLHVILSELRAKPSETLVIGDHESDAKSAQAVNADCALVASGTRTFSQLSSAQPARGVFADLPTLLKEVLSL